MGDSEWAWHLPVQDFTPAERKLVEEHEKTSRENVDVIKRLDLLRKAKDLQDQQEEIDGYIEDIAELEGQKIALHGHIVNQSREIAQLKDSSTHASPEEVARLRVELERANTIIEGVLTSYNKPKRERVKKWAKNDEGNRIIPQDFLENPVVPEQLPPQGESSS
ncbi:hypothetical protein TWF730_008422 [Orbilia blumenaviensis]|uniref:Uncharacterized protein n=1 Tax=Orbilia blumenaviensis TaxID=1796055 RepID=A0AAV9V4Z7_9PEZI